MNAIALLVLALDAFLLSHFLLSHPLRRPLVDRIGEKAFLGLYSLIAFATLGTAIAAYGPAAASDPVPRWGQSDTVFAIATALMWFASVLLVGSLRGNPALPTAGRPIAIGKPRGVFAITRHPMMWSFAIWAFVHAIIVPIPASFWMSAAIAVLAIGGAIGQDRKKRKRLGEPWRDWMRRTAFVPFAKGGAIPDAVALGGGTLLWLAATWAHGALGYRPAGIFHFFA